MHLLQLAEKAALSEDELLVKVEAAGVGNWDEVVRTGGWDVGSVAPMALGVEAAGSVLQTGAAVTSFSPGDRVLTHPLPLRHQGAWAERVVATVDTTAAIPDAVPWETAGAFPVPALTALQVLTEALSLEAGSMLLVHGAGGVTGSLIVQLAQLHGIGVVATARSPSHARLTRLGAREVVDRSSRDWVDQASRAVGRGGAAAAVNAVRGGAASALRAVADGGKLVTITSDPPPEERGISVANFYVRPDGDQLASLAELLGAGKLGVVVSALVGLEGAGPALESVTSGASRGAVVVAPGRR